MGGLLCTDAVLTSYPARRILARVTSNPPVHLKYFDARGRAQFLRYFLLCREIPFEDDRVPLTADFASWLAIREDRYAMRC